MTAPLEDITVVEIATFVAAPAAGALLADLGADVIKVEAPGGEMVRFVAPRLNGFESDFSGSPMFEMDNRGKRSLVLDLSKEAGRAALHRVIDRADVVLTNVLPQRRVKLGIDAQTLRARKPELIFAALSGYGGRGPEANTPAFDYAAYWARTGMMDITRQPGVPPGFQRPGVGDHAAAVALVCGILAALRVRDRGGGGQEIDVSLLQTGLYALGNDLSQVLATGRNAPMHDRCEPRNPLWNHYETADGRWIMLTMIESHRYWRPFLEAIERLDLEDDERFCGPVERFRNSRALVEILDGIFRARTLVEWEKRLTQYRLIWSPVRRMAEAIEDPQARAMGYFRTVEHPELGPFETVGPPLLLSGHEMPCDRPAPPLGKHSVEILRAAGLEDDEIERVLGVRPSDTPKRD